MCKEVIESNFISRKVVCYTRRDSEDLRLEKSLP